MPPARQRDRTLLLVLAVVVLLAVGARAAETADNVQRARRTQMIEEQIVERGVRAPEVLRALRRVPRHEFVPAGSRDQAYADGPLPIGYGQTISQPYIVALMTEVLKLERGHKVLEIGTGSGYQAAVLAEITDQVYTMEIIEPLARSATDRLKRLGYDKVHVQFADGYHGWPEHAPYDAIIVTAAADLVPPPLLEQLKPKGRMVIPLGGPFQRQWLVLVEKDAAGKISTRTITGVAFVPFTRKTEK